MLDLRTGKEHTLFEQMRVQEALRVVYERAPDGWWGTRAMPFLIARLLESLVNGWSSILPLRVFVLHDEEDRWWVEAVAERCRASKSGLRVERVALEGDPGGGFCTPARCSLFQQVQQSFLGPVVFQERKVLAP
ncbi:MAG TPA: hypothetical protein ENI37_08340 [Chloroflexi bacterium]|nr:hypothetical protein [Chloroflexota bacterium]